MRKKSSGLGRRIGHAGWHHPVALSAASPAADDYRWYRSLSLPARAMLLIALSLDDGFYLPFDKAKSWYGVSADTARTGFGELSANGLLKVTTRYLTAPLTPAGFIERRHYTLRPPFDRAARSARPRSRKATAR